MSNHIELEVTKTCCEVWPIIKRELSWMRFGEEPHTHKVGMPHIDDGHTKWRVNFCPSCGAERRNAIEFYDSVTK